MADSNIYLVPMQGVMMQVEEREDVEKKFDREVGPCSTVLKTYSMHVRYFQKSFNTLLIRGIVEIMQDISNSIFVSSPRSLKNNLNSSGARK